MKLPPSTRNERENVIPLINVVFLLLIFFMIAGQMVQPEALAVTPPEVTSEHDITGMEEKLLVDKNGTIMLGEKSLDLPSLTSLFRGHKDDPIVVKIDKDCPRKCFLPVLDALQKAGLKKVRLVTLQAP